MRTLIVTTIMSLDGYFEGPGGDIMALPMDEVSFNAHNLQRLRAAGTLLAGASTYTGFAGYWPYQLDNPDPTQREIAEINSRIEKVVVSDRLSEADTGPWRDTTTIVRRAEAHERIAELKRQDGGDILTFGSHVLWNDLLTAGLVDELHMMVGCVVLGGGTPAFERALSSRLRLLGTRTWDGSGNVLIRYAVD